VALPCDPPKGQPGRPSKSLTLDQAVAVLAAADADPTVMRAYVVVSLQTGARTEELRALTWSHVDLGESGPATLSLWRSVRAGGDTKTKKSRRTLELPSRCVEALRAHRMAQLQDRLAVGERWVDQDLVFTTSVGTALDAANVRRVFRRVLAVAGLDASEWTPRELRHSFVSLLSDAGVPVEMISQLVGHRGTSVTEIVYRHQIRPVIQTGATVMDELFGLAGDGR
jgi:integrase